MATIYHSYWVPDASGLWSVGSNWATEVPNSSPTQYSPTVPGSSYDVSITPYNPATGVATGTNPFTITYATTDTIFSLEGPAFATLAFQSGSLTITSSMNIAGPLNVSGGTLDLQNGGASNLSSAVGARDSNYNLLPGLTLTGGTVQIDAGALVLIGANAISGGTVTGAGSLYVSGFASLTVSADNTIQSGTFELGVTPNGTVSHTYLGSDLAYTGHFQIDNYSGNSAILYLQGHKLTLTGTSEFDGTIDAGTGGTLLLTSGETATLSNGGYSGFYGLGLTMINQGTIVEDQKFVLSGSLDNQANAILNFTQDHGIDSTGTGFSVTNEGTIRKTAGTGASTIYGALTSSGTIDAQTGSIGVSGTGGTISGVLKGLGEIDLGGGGTYTLAAALSSLAVATFGWFDVGTKIVLGRSFSYGGTLNTSVTFGNLTIDLNGKTLTLTKALNITGAYGAVVLTDGGKVLVASGATASVGGLNIAGGVTLENAGSLSANYDIYLDSDSGASQSLFQNDATGVVTITQDRTIFSQTGTAALITNAGKIVKTAGTGISDIYVALNNTGTIEVDQGELRLHGGGTLGGTLSGAGALTLRGNSTTYTLATGLTPSVATLNVYDSTDVVLGQDVSYGGAFFIGGAFANPTLDLGGHTLTLTKTATFTAPYATIAIIDGGAVKIAAGATVAMDSVGIAGGVTIENAGTLTDNGYIHLDSDKGAAQSLVQNDAGAVLNIAVDGNVFDQTGTAALITNAGTINKTQGTGTSDIYVSLTSIGTLSAATGFIALHDGATLSGTLSGAGGLVLRSGGTYTLGAGLTTLSIAALSVYDNGTDIVLGRDFTYAGTFNVGNSFQNPTIDLGGHTLTLSGAATFTAPYAKITVTDGGTLKIAVGGTATMDSTAINAGVTLENAGTLADNGYITLDADGGAAASVLRNDAGGVLNFTADGPGLISGGASAALTNAGKIAKTAGTGTTTIAVSVSGAGGIAAATGTLALTGPSNSLSGALTGAGTIQFAGGATALNSGITASVANLAITGGGTTVTVGANLAYAGSFSQGGGTTLSLTGGYLNLTGNASFSGATVNGSQRLYVRGTTTIAGLTIGGTAVFQNVKTATQSGGTVTIGDTGGNVATLFNMAGATYAIADDSGIARGTAAGSTILNQGAFQKTGGTATSTVAASITSSGSVAVATGTLAFTGPANSFTGALTGAGTLVLGGGKTTLASGTTASVAALSLSGSGTSVTLNTNLTYAGTFTAGAGTTLSVGNGFGLTLTGTSGLSGIVSGAGTLQLGGGATTINNGTVLSVAKLALSGSGTVATIGTNLAYGGSFTQGAGTTLNLTGGYLNLTGAANFAGATVTGSQRLYTRGATTLAGLTIGGTAVFQDMATVTQAGGTVTVGDTSASAAVLFNAAGATYSITDNSGIARGTAAASYLLNQGTLQKTGGAGTSAILLNINNNAAAAGTLAVTSGTLDLGGTLSGNLALKVGAGATMILEKSATAGSAAAFTGANATLQLNDSQDYHGTIAGFAGSETLDLRSIRFGTGITTTLGYSGNGSGGILKVSDGTRTANLSMLGSYSQANFHLASDNHGGSAITFA